jgi:hypothetical protein
MLITFLHHLKLYFVVILFFSIIDLPSANISFDPKECPLLHSPGSTPMHLDRLVQEILKFHGNGTIHFTHGNDSFIQDERARR